MVVQNTTGSIQGLIQVYHQGEQVIEVDTFATSKRGNVYIGTSPTRSRLRKVAISIVTARNNLHWLRSERI